MATRGVLQLVIVTSLGLAALCAGCLGDSDSLDGPDAPRFDNSARTARRNGSEANRPWTWQPDTRPSADRAPSGRPSSPISTAGTSPVGGSVQCGSSTGPVTGSGAGGTG